MTEEGRSTGRGGCMGVSEEVGCSLLCRKLLLAVVQVRGGGVVLRLQLLALEEVLVVLLVG